MQALLPTESFGPGPLQALRDGRLPMSKDAIEEVGTQFEGVFMSMLIKELRESLEDGMFAGENSDTYGALFDLYLGQHMAQSGGLGIKQMLVQRYAQASVTNPQTEPRT